MAHYSGGKPSTMTAPRRGQAAIAPSALPDTLSIGRELAALAFEYQRLLTLRLALAQGPRAPHPGMSAGLPFRLVLRFCNTSLGRLLANPTLKARARHCYRRWRGRGTSHGDHLGGGGFIGSAVADRPLREGHSLRISSARGFSPIAPSTWRRSVGDRRHAPLTTCRRAYRPDAVIHLLPRPCRSPPTTTRSTMCRALW
jgi:hypothetical protein